MYPAGIRQKRENGIAIVEKTEELNIRYSIISRAAHLVPCITDKLCVIFIRGGGAPLLSLSLG